MQRKLTIEKSAPNHFVDRVVASDVLTGNFQFTLGIKNSGSMNSACVREIALCIAQFFRKRKQHFHIDAEICPSYRWEILPASLNTCLAAKTATAGNCLESLRRIQFRFHTVF